MSLELHGSGPSGISELYSVISVVSKGEPHNPTSGVEVCMPIIQHDVISPLFEDVHLALGNFLVRAASITALPNHLISDREDQICRRPYPVHTLLLLAIASTRVESAIILNINILHSELFTTHFYIYIKQHTQPLSNTLIRHGATITRAIGSAQQVCERIFVQPARRLMVL